MELKDLHCFVAVAEEESFSRAAGRLHMTQPPLSMRIKQLEDEVGASLFTRTTRRVQLTDAGWTFLADVRQLLLQLEQSVQTARRVGRGEVGRLALGFVPSAANEVLPPLLKAFRQRYPQVTLSLHELSPAELAMRLRAKRIDAAFFYLPSGQLPPFGHAELDSKPVSWEPLVAVFPEGHPLTAQRRIDLALLAGEPFILVASHRGSGLRDLILEQCRKAGFAPNVVQEATLIQTIGGLVASGVGVSLVPASLRRLQTVGVDYRPIKADETPQVAMGIVWRHGDSHPLLQAFLDIASSDPS